MNPTPSFWLLSLWHPLFVFVRNCPDRTKLLALFMDSGDIVGNIWLKNMPPVSL
jgi:hypothetical protein